MPTFCRDRSNTFCNGSQQLSWSSHQSFQLLSNFALSPYFSLLGAVGVVIITTAQLHSTKPELRSLHRFKSCSQRVEDSRWWRSLIMAPAGNKNKRLSSVNHTTKTIHHSSSSSLYLKYFAWFCSIDGNISREKWR